MQASASADPANGFRRPPAGGGSRADRVDVSALLAPPGEGPIRYAGHESLPVAGHQLGELLAQEAGPALEEARLVELHHAITNADRAVGARVGGLIGKRFGAGKPPGRVRAYFEGAAGQSFGAFLAAGVTLTLTGEANAYVGKGMSGGRIVVIPPEDDAGDPVLLGNTVLYGATGGELYCAGRAGERFAVRLSGASAVVEGTGGNPCEYMTAGTVVLLGEVGRNLGAGMTGGEVYVFDPGGVLRARLNDELVDAGRLTMPEAEPLRALVERHVRYTSSARGAGLLEDWGAAVESFWCIRPRADVDRLSRVAEGTAAEGGS